MTEDRHAKMLERVRALLAKADSTTFPDEAESFRTKADELMTRYAIEQWQVEEAQAGVGARPKPKSRDFDMSWYKSNSRKNELWTLMQAVAEHCRVKLVYWSYTRGTVPGVGLESDLNYFDMLFTHLMLQVAKGLEPKPDPDKDVIENLVMLKEAGLNWERVYDLLDSVGQLEQVGLVDIGPGQTAPEWAVVRSNIGRKMTQLYTDYCAEHNRPRLRTVPSVWQRSYAVGFIEELRRRLRHQEERADYTGSMELALRDIRIEVDEAAEEMFGKDPDRYGVERSGAIDASAYQVGAVDGRNVSISHNPNQTMRQGAQKELS